jgi:hypothetical protein
MFTIREITKNSTHLGKHLCFVNGKETHFSAIAGFIKRTFDEKKSRVECDGTELPPKDEKS